jgi:hypothetical protein
MTHVDTLLVHSLRTATLREPGHYRKDEKTEDEKMKNEENTGYEGKKIRRKEKTRIKDGKR